MRVPPVPRARVPRRRSVLATAVAACSVLGAAACSAGGSGSRSGAPISAVVAAYPVAEAVVRVGGHRVDVMNLTEPGAEPHDLELRPSQVDAIEDADVVFVLGDGFQPALEERAGQRDEGTVALLDEVGDRRAPQARDPHVWLDPVQYGELVDVVADVLARIDPEHHGAFEANANRFHAEIDAIDERFASGLRACDRRTIVTTHAAFGHLAARYDLTQRSIAGKSPDEEPGTDRIADLADLAREQGVTTVFTETLVSPDLARTLAREAGGLRTDVLNPLEGLTAREIRRGEDWASVMERNLTALRRALGCS